MLQLRSVAVLSVCLGLSAGLAASQQKPESDQKGADTAGDVPPAAAIPDLTLEVEKREKIAGIPPGMPTLAPTMPLEGGGMLVRYVHLPTGPPDAAHPFSLDPVMVRVKSAQETNRFDDSYPGLSGVVSDGRIAVSKNQVVLLVHAITNDEKLNAPDTRPHSFLVFYDLDGRLEKIAAVDVGPGVSAMGAFANGEILIAYSTYPGGGSMRRHLSFYDDKGEFQRELYQDNPDIGLKKEHQSFSFPAGRILAVFPYGDNLLVVYKAEKGVLLDELNPAGVVREWDLVLPQGAVSAGLVPSDGPYWLVSYEKAREGTGPAHYVDGIFEFDKATLEVVGNLTSSAPQILMGAVYQHGSEVVELLNDPKDYSAQFAVASIVGK